ncbi:hypothetical protein MMC12_001035 [Toensbergia leucococca]|nr:hypothetical protein [Toensbergia leucococca]
MFSPPQRACLQLLNCQRCPSASLPDFLIPAFLTPKHAFSTTTPRASRIGKTVLSLPPEVNLRFLEPLKSRRKATVQRVEPPRIVEVEGPLGKMSMNLPNYMILDHNQSTKKATLRIQDSSQRKQLEMWGTTRAYLQNHILGVSEGHTAILRLVGVGYRATVEPIAITKIQSYPNQQFVNLRVGYSHPVELGVPEGVKASTPQPTRILLEGVEKEVVMQFAAKIRMWRKPEPYKGKGIFVNGETIKLKAKKIK